MTKRIAVAIALALPGLLVAGCSSSGSGKKTPSLQQGLPFADRFVRAFIVRGRWQLAKPYVSPLYDREFRSLQKDLVKDNVRRVVGRTVANDCPPNPGVGAGNDCIAYRLAGGSTEPISGKRTAIRSRFRVWLSYDSGRWQVVSYDYDAKVTHPRS